MFESVSSAARLAVVALVVPFAAQAADKKAEGELKWAMNYCGKVFKELDRIKASDSSPDRLEGQLAKLTGDVEKYKDYLAKATAIDPTVLESTTVYDKKENRTYAQGVERCKTIDAEIAALSGKASAGQEAKAAAKAQERADWEKDEAKRGAMNEVNDAIRNECAIFRKWKTSGDFEQRLANYEQHKKAALAAMPAIAGEKYTAPLLDEGGAEAETTKTVGEWFAFCDKMMPEQLTKVRAAEKAAAAAESAAAAKQKAYNDRLRAEDEAKMKALLGSTGGDRNRILKSKGYLPNWPRGGDLKSAPVWKYEVNITGEVQRCETYQFSGDKLTRNSTALGGCG